MGWGGGGAKFSIRFFRCATYTYRLDSVSSCSKTYGTMRTSRGISQGMYNAL